MTIKPNPARKHIKSRKSGLIKSSRTYIDPNDFYLMRRRAFLTTLEAARLLDVTHKTLQNWEKGRTRIPYTAYRVLKIKVGYVFDDEFFKDWFVRGDTLWSPENRGFKPYELRYLASYLWMARRWLAERQAAKNLSRVMTSTLERGAASNGSPATTATRHLARSGGAGTLPLGGATPLHDISQDVERLLGLQKEKPPEFERFLRELGIAIS